MILVDEAGENLISVASGANHALTPQELEPAADRIRTAGARHVIVTLGAKGALLAGPDRTALIPSEKVDAIDTTAAGAAFNGGLAWALGCGMELERAVRQACLVGALSAMRLGAQPSLPTKEELDCFTERGCPSSR